MASEKPDLPLQLQNILDDITRAISVNLYYPALLVALTVPEICSALEVDDSVFIKEKQYAAFVDKYTTPSTLGLSGIECYRLRGGVVHRGNAAGHPFFGSSHVIFSIPESRADFHALTLSMGEKSAAMFNLVEFCETMISAAERWYVDHSDEQIVKKNIARLLSMRPNGVPPFLEGAPVVASGE